MKHLLLSLIVMIPFLSYCQTGYEGARNNGVNQTTERYVINSPGNTPSNSVTTWRVKDSTYIEWLFRDAYLRRLPNTVNDGNPINFLHTDANGRVLSSSISWLYPDTLNTFVTKYYLRSNFYDKSESDLKYLQSFTELDPTVASYIKAITTSDINFWNDKSWINITGKPSFSTVATSGSYHNLIDTPVLTPTDISNWNTAYSWGNPSGVYVPLTRMLTINGTTQDLSVNRSWTIPGTDTSNLSARIDTKQNISDTNTVDATRYWVNIQGFLKGTDTISLSNRINTKFTIPTGTTGQYVRGDGSLTSFPTIPDQYNPTAGTGISITGIYPNQTITNTSPFVPWVITNNVSRSIVNVAAAANGFQISSSRNSEVKYSVTISSTVSLSGSGTGYVVLETSPTNSSTASDWIEIGRVSSGQSGTLVIGLVLNQIGGGQICGTIPSGYYVRLRSVTIGGTPTYTYNSGQEVLQ